MLPLWHEQLRIALCRDKVILVRVCEGWKPRVIGKRAIPCERATAGQPIWSPAVNSLADTLQHFPSTTADTTVILSNHFAKYLVVPWNEQLGDEQETMAFVRQRFEKVYGKAAGHWEFRLSTGQRGALSVASAIDTCLLDAIRETLKPTRLRLRSIEPYLIASFNHLRDHFKNSRTWFVLAGQGTLCISLFDRGEWRRLSSIKAGNNWLAELPLILEREAHLAGLCNATLEILLYAPGQTAPLPQAGGKWKIRLLTQPVPTASAQHGDALFALASTG